MFVCADFRIVCPYHKWSFNRAPRTLTASFTLFYRLCVSHMHSLTGRQARMGSAVKGDYFPLAQKVEQDGSKPGCSVWQHRTLTLANSTSYVEHSNCSIISSMLQLQGYKPQQCAFWGCWGYGFGHWGSCVVQYIYKYQHAMNAQSTVASCHWQFNCSSFSNSPFQHICLFFGNLGTSLSEVTQEY